MSSLFEKNEKKVFILGLLLSLLGPFCFDSFLPSLPAMALYFKIPASTIQLSITLYLIGVSFSQLFYGPLSDKYGRRRMILIGVSISFVGVFICMVSRSIPLFLFGRLIQGIGLGVCNSLFRALFRDTFSAVKMAKINSYGSMCYSATMAFAPVIGGYIQILQGWRANFIFQFILVFIILLIIKQALPETLATQNPDATKFRVVVQNYKTLLTHPSFMKFTGLSMLAFAGMIAYFTVGPFLFQNTLGLTADEFGWISVTITLGLLVGQFFNTILLNALSFQKSIWVGNGVMFMSGLVMLVISLMGIINVWVVLIPVIFFIMGAGLVFANAMTGAFQPFPHMAGIAGGLYGCLQVMGSFISSWGVAHLPHTNQTSLAALLLSLGLISLLINLFFQEKKECDSDSH
jgi:MFS transporter, DHA1 family, 2-module integral membrane pump EmrD